MRIGLITVTLMVTLVVTACDRILPSASDSGGRLKVAATVAPIADLVRQVGGSHVALTQIVPDGSDSHTFEPRPSDVRALSDAQLVVMNGLHLEEPTRKLAEANRRAGAHHLLLGDNTISRTDWLFDFSFPESEGDPNPHLWLDPVLSQRYVELIRDKLAEMDTGNATSYSANAAALIERLDALDQAIAEATRTVPPANRKLLTYHDSWAYFAKRYGYEVIGAIQPSDFSEPSPQEMARLVDQIRTEQVVAIFGSEVFPSRVLEVLGRETGVRYVDTLSDDELPGEAGSPEHTYQGLMQKNLRTMVSALGGQTTSLDALDPRSVAR